MKRNYIPHIIGVIFIILGASLWGLILSHWSLSVRTIKGFPAILGACSLFLIVGIAVLTIGIKTNIKIKRYIFTIRIK